MVHLKDLLIDHCNPIARAQYFGVIFNEIGSYDEICAGTTLNYQIPGVNELFSFSITKTSHWCAREDLNL